MSPGYKIVSIDPATAVPTVVSEGDLPYIMEAGETITVGSTTFTYLSGEFMHFPNTSCGRMYPREVPRKTMVLRKMLDDLRVSDKPLFPSRRDITHPKEPFWRRLKGKNRGWQ